MTMLDRMRRHKGWLKWSLAIVILAFIVLYIPSFLEPGMAGNSDVVASVEGREITVGRFRQAYQRQMQAYRAQFGGNVDEKMLKQLGIDQRIVQQMIEEETALAEASRIGISATDQEVRARIATMPGLLENGQFIGEERYRQMLEMQSMTPSEFEEQIRRAVTLQKLQAALTNWMTVDDKELETEFKRRNEKVKLAVVSFPADKFREGLEATDAELSAYYEAHKNELKIPEKRKVKYALVDMQAMRNRTQVSPQDIERAYEDNQQQYSTPEQVRASHILLKTEGKDDAAVKKQAEDLLAKVKGGADFAQLATKYSEDAPARSREAISTSSAKAAWCRSSTSGVLDEAGRDQRSRQDAVRLPHHQVTERGGEHQTARRGAGADRDQVKWERAQAEAQRIANEVRKPEEPRRLRHRGEAAGPHRRRVRPVQQRQPIAGLGVAPAVAERAFELKEGSQRIDPHPAGLCVHHRHGPQDSYVPKLDEVKARVRDEVLKKKAIDVARQRAATVGTQMKSETSRGGESAGLEIKTTEFIARAARLATSAPAPRSTRWLSRCRWLGQRPHRDGQRYGDCEGARAAGSGALGYRVREDHVEGGASERAPDPVLRVLYEQGARTDEGECEPGAACAAGGLKNCSNWRFANRDSRLAIHRMNTFGMIASGSPLRKT